MAKKLLATKKGKKIIKKKIVKTIPAKKKVSGGSSVKEKKMGPKVKRVQTAEGWKRQMEKTQKK